MDRSHGVRVTICFPKLSHCALQSNQAAVHFRTKDAMFWDTMFSVLFPVDESPQITNSTADVNGCLSPCSVSNSCKVGRELLGMETQVLLDCARAKADNCDEFSLVHMSELLKVRKHGTLGNTDMCTFAQWTGNKNRTMYHVQSLKSRLTCL